MSRFSSRLCGITACLALVVFAAPSWAQFDDVAHVPVHQVAQAAQPPHCVNVDIPNNTGQTVNDLHFLMDGVTEVTWFYNGPKNPFGPPSFHGLAPDGNYEVHFAGADVDPNEIVHYGVCTDSVVTDFVGRTGNGKFYLPYQWTDCGEPVSFVPLPLVGNVFNRSGRTVTLTNALARDAVLADAQFAVVAEAVDLDVLRIDELPELPWAPLAARGQIVPGVREGGEAGTFTTEPLPVGVGEVVLLHFDLVPADDPGAPPIRVTSQFRVE